MVLSACLYTFLSNHSRLDKVLADSLLCFLFNVVSWARVIAEVDDSSETVKAVAYCDVQRFSEYSITLLRISDNLGVAA